MTFLLFSLFLIVVVLLTLATRPVGWSAFALRAFTIGAGAVIVGGYLLSALNLLAQVNAWLGVISVLMVAGILLFLRTKPDRVTLVRNLSPRISAFVAEFRRAPRLTRGIIVMVGLTLVITAALNLFVALFTTPHNWDSLSYHLPRVAYYLQHGNTEPYPANYWAQVLHPNGSALLRLFVFLSSGRNENWMALVQYVSYLVSVTSVYALTRRSGASRLTGFIAAGVFGLTTVVLMQATTTQDDLIMTAFIACGLVALFDFRATQKRGYLVLAAINLALSGATKSTAGFMAPSLLLAVLFVLFDRAPHVATGVWNGTLFAGMLLVALVVLTLPAGFFQNYRLYGEPFGPASVREGITGSGQGTNLFYGEGFKNAVRMVFDSLSLDGVPPSDEMVRLQKGLRAPLIALVQATGADLEDPTYSRVEFRYNRPPRAHEDWSFLGILGFGLLLPLVVLQAIGVGGNRATHVLAWMVILAWVTVAFAVTYEPWHGRRLTTAAMFAAPCLSVLEPMLLGQGRKSRLIRVAFAAILALGCLAGISAILFRTGGALVTRYEQSILTRNRMEQFSANRPPMLEPLTNFENQVPADAIVAVDLPLNSYEYPLFGEGLTRRLYPINSVLMGRQPIPAQAQYLVFDQTLDVPVAGDSALGQGWYLRTLK